MPPRVMQVMAGAPVGGIETFFFDATLALAEAGVSQHLVVRPNAAFQIARARQAGVTVSTASFSPWFIWPTKRALAGIVAAFRPDIIQYWTGRAAMYAPKTGAHQIAWYGGYRDRGRHSTCTDFIGITRDLVRHIKEEGVAPDHIALIHTFAEHQAAPPLDRGDMPKDAPLLLALARLHWKKGLDVLLDALARVPGAHLWIAGEGGDRSKLEAQVARLGLTNRVRFLGWRTDREALLATADICVFPSRFEPFGTVMIEAWAAGTPLIAAAAQGPAAYVENGKNGLLVPVDDAGALAAAISRAIADTALRARLVEVGRETYEQHFTKQVYVRDMLAFYDRVMENR